MSRLEEDLGEHFPAVAPIVSKAIDLDVFSLDGVLNSTLQPLKVCEGKIQESRRQYLESDLLVDEATQASLFAKRSNTTLADSAAELLATADAISLVSHPLAQLHDAEAPDTASCPDVAPLLDGYNRPLGLSPGAVRAAVGGDTRAASVRQAVRHALIPTLEAAMHRRVEDLSSIVDSGEEPVRDLPGAARRRLAAAADAEARTAADKAATAAARGAEVRARVSALRGLARVATVARLGAGREADAVRVAYAREFVRTAALKMAVVEQECSDEVYTAETCRALGAIEAELDAAIRSRKAAVDALESRVADYNAAGPEFAALASRMRALEEQLAEHRSVVARLSK